LNRIDGKNLIDKLQYQQRVNNRKNDESGSFGKLLDQKLNSFNSHINFSKHAKERITARGIEISQEDLERISEAISKADEKGIRNSLIVTEKAVYIANIKSKTIITAMEDMKDRVFTNVDGVINI
jgi:flagellar operon protein